MKLGISTASFYPQINTEETIDIISDLGISTIEIFLQTESEYNEEFANILLNKITKKGICVHSIHGSSSQYEPQLFSKYQRELTDSLSTFEKIFKACKVLNAKNYVFHGPRIMDFNRNSWDFIIERMKIISQMAKEFGICVAQENVSWCISSDIRFLNYLRDQDLDNLYFTFDNKQAVKSSANPIEVVRVMGEKLVNVHLSDVRGEQIGIFPGQGDYDFGTLFYELEKIGYKGPAFVEVYGKHLPVDLRSTFSKFKDIYF